MRQSSSSSFLPLMCRKRARAASKEGAPKNDFRAHCTYYITLLRNLDWSSSALLLLSWMVWGKSTYVTTLPSLVPCNVASSVIQGHTFCFRGGGGGGGESALLQAGGGWYGMVLSWWWENIRLVEERRRNGYVEKKAGPCDYCYIRTHVLYEYVWPKLFYYLAN